MFPCANLFLQTKTWCQLAYVLKAGNGWVHTSAKYFEFYERKVIIIIKLTIQSTRMCKSNLVKCCWDNPISVFKLIDFYEACNSEKGNFRHVVFQPRKTVSLNLDGSLGNWMIFFFSIKGREWGKSWPELFSHLGYYTPCLTNGGRSWNLYSIKLSAPLLHSKYIAPYDTIIATETRSCENLVDVWEIFTGGEVKRLPFYCLLLIKYMSTLDRFDTSVKGHKLNSNSLSLLEIPPNIRYFKWLQ